MKSTVINSCKVNVEEIPTITGTAYKITGNEAGKLVDIFNTFGVRAISSQHEYSPKSGEDSKASLSRSYTFLKDHLYWSPHATMTEALRGFERASGKIVVTK